MSLQNDIAKVLNKASAENESNTPDWILAEYLIACLAAFDIASQRREDWYGHRHYPGKDAGAPLDGGAKREGK